MSWNKALPGDSEKIRDLGVVIRPNWEAIEEGDDVGVSSMLEMRSVQLDNRTGLAANNDPITNAGTQYLYSKDDGGGTQEAYTKDSAGNTIQLTNGGKIGATDVDYEADSISFDGTVTYNENSMFRAWGLIAAGGASFTLNRNFVGVSSGGTGVYVVDITALGPAGANFASADSYGVIATAAVAGSRNHICSITSKTATAFTIVVKNDANTAGSVAVSVILLT